MKIALPVIATVAVLTLLQASYPLVREAKAARPILALTNMQKSVLDNTTVQVHVNRNDGTMTVNGQEVPAGQPYVQNDQNGSVEVSPLVIQKSMTGPNGEIGKSSTSTSITITGTKKLDMSQLTPEQQALMQKAIQGTMNIGQSSSSSPTIVGVPGDSQQAQSILNGAGIVAPTDIGGNTAQPGLSPDQQALIQKAIQDAMKGGQSSSVVAFINGKQVDPQQVKSLLNMSGINLSINTNTASH